MKKNILMIVGMGDDFFHEKSPRCLRRPGIDNVKRTICSLVSSGKYDGYVNVLEANDSNYHVNLFSTNPRSISNVIDFRLYESCILHQHNRMIINDVTADIDNAKYMDGDQLDHILRSTEYNIHVAGVDINGIFVGNDKVNGIIDDFPEHRLLFVSNAIVPFNKRTIDILKDKNKKSKNVTFRKIDIK